MANDIYIVYETTNLINGKYYIGVHKINRKNYLGTGKILKLAIEKYGRDNFIHDVLKSFDNEQNAYDYEKFIVDENLVQNENCYNIVEGGGNPPTGSGINNNFYGNNHNKGTKLKISENRKGKCCDEEHWNYGNSVLDGNEQQCYELYKSGKSLKQIAEYFDVGYVTVYNCLLKDKQCKLLLRRNNTDNKRVLNDSQIEEVIKMKKDGFSLRKIGRYFNVSHHTVSNYIKKTTEDQ